MFTSHTIQDLFKPQLSFLRQLAYIALAAVYCNLREATSASFPVKERRGSSEQSNLLHGKHVTMQQLVCRDCKISMNPKVAVKTKKSWCQGLYKNMQKVMTFFQMKNRGRWLILFSFFNLSSSVTWLFPTWDNATIDGLSKDTPDICGKAGNSTKPGVHS